MLTVPEKLAQKMFDAEDKDVTFNLSDGSSQKAHSVVLAASSDVFKSMLAHDMREKNGAIELTDVSCVAMRVFLRMLYTGHVCEEDWSWADHGDPRPALAVPVPEDAAAPPLAVLMSVLTLAIKYMCHEVRSGVIEAVKGRLDALRGSDEKTVSVFEDIMSLAIRQDVGPLRMAALEKAKSWKGLRKRYEANKLRSEVQFELEAIWPAPKTPLEGCSKRKRLV